MVMVYLMVQLFIGIIIENVEVKGKMAERNDRSGHTCPKRISQRSVCVQQLQVGWGSNRQGQVRPCCYSCGCESESSMCASASSRMGEQQARTGQALLLFLWV